jgi:hypothetical protein
VDEAMFECVANPNELIFYILSIDKSDLLIISLLVVLKKDFGEVDEAMLQGVENPYELIFVS